MKNAFFLLVGVALIAGSVFLYFTKPNLPENKIKIIKINETQIEVEIASTPESRSQGLSNRTNLEEGKGMLFVFEKLGFYGFWMKDMNFPIDIVWVDENLVIIGIEKSVSPDTFPQILYPKQAIKYVLELPAGFSDKNHIDIGQVIYLDVYPHI